MECIHLYSRIVGRLFVRRILLCITFSTISVLALAQSKYNLIFYQDFEHHDAPIEYTTSLWNPDWNNPGWRDGDHRPEGWWAENIKDSIVVDRETESKVMKFNFSDTIIDGVGGYWPVRGGDLWVTELGAEPKELYFSYNVKFRPGFNFVKGGKLPGTRGGTPLSYYTLSNSLPPADNEGYSCNLMFKSEGRVQWYLYHHDYEELYGHNITWDSYQPEGLNYTDKGAVSLDVSSERWYNITMRVVVNTISNGQINRDGIMEGFIDGKLVSSISGLYLIPASDIDKGVNRISIAHFFGGTGVEFSPARDEWTLLDDFVCFTYDESVDVPRGNTPSQPGRVLELPNLKTVREIDQEPPSVPNQLRSTNKSDSFIDIIWLPSKDNTGVEGYRVFINGHEHARSEFSSCRLSGLSPETTYSISVSAFDSFGNESARSEAIFVTTSPRDTIPNPVDTIPPPPPSGLQVVDTTEISIGISWDALPETIGLDSYQVYLDGIIHGKSISNSYTVSGLQAGTTYSISLTAIDQAQNESQHSNEVRVTTLDSIDSQEPGLPGLPALPALPELEITELSRNLLGNEVSVLTELRALGHSDLIDYGVVVSRKGSTLDKDLICASQDESSLIHNKRVEKGLELLYNFSEGQGNIVFDRSGSESPMNLEIYNPLAVRWLPGQGLKVNDHTIISSEEVPRKLLSSIEASNEISIESWIRTGSCDQNGPARIVSISRDSDSRVATLGQRGNDATYNYIARLSTSATDENGTPEVSPAEEFDLPSLHHLVYTRNQAGEERIYINGEERYAGVRAGTISAGEESNYIALANEISGEKPWIGNYYLVAVYNKALDEQDIALNYQAGVGTVQFSAKLAIEQQESYEVTPFARTVQGISYGDPYMIDSTTFLFETYSDTLLMEIYPNPSNGDFRIRILCNTQDVPYAVLRVSDMMGRVVFTEHVPMNEIFEEYPINRSPTSGELLSAGKEIELKLSSMLDSGVYLVSLIVGDKVAGRRFIIQ